MSNKRKATLNLGGIGADVQRRVQDLERANGCTCNVSVVLNPAPGGIEARIQHTPECGVDRNSTLDPMNATEDPR